MSNLRTELHEKNNYVISLKLFGGLVIAFLAGYFAHNLIANSNSVTVYSFSTPDLINFVLSVLLSGASIILAISAISLGKFSEQAMIQRSDESIRLQNEVFQKTTDALQRIESSTGVTEKRLEDIIAGRVGDLSEKIARIATETKEKDGSLKPEEIENLIRNNLFDSIATSGSFRSTQIGQEEARLERDKQRQLETQKYNSQHSQLEAAITNRKDLRAIKLGQGDPVASGLKLFDIVYVNKDEKKTGIIDYPVYIDLNTVRSSVESAFKELQEGTVDFVYILIYESNEKLERTYNKTLSIINPELKAKISLVVCLPDQISQLVKTL
jgi:hypothetical protein